MSDAFSVSELKNRWHNCLKNLNQHTPQAEGILIFSRLNIYYFSGSLVNGVLWLPMQDEPVLFCRRGIERAKIESPIKNIVSFNSYREIIPVFNELRLKIPTIIAAEMKGLPWSLSQNLLKHLPNQQFISGDKIISMTRAKKSSREIEILEQAGIRHDRALTQQLPQILGENISELEVSHRLMQIFLAEGHHGILRMENFGEETFLGHISMGDNANYPGSFNGPVGVRGIHPATPFMGSAETLWQPGQALTVDTCFSYQGYTTDKTQVYWLGPAEQIPDNVRKAHDFCIELQNQAARALVPGAIPSEIWANCLAEVNQSTWTEGFMGLGKNKVNFLGHGIGLAIDEYPVLAEGFDLPLEDGMVLAIEPKIGIPGVGMVGVENTFKVTPSGGKSLTGGKFEIITI